MCQMTLIVGIPEAVSVINLEYINIYGLCFLCHKVFFLNLRMHVIYSDDYKLYIVLFMTSLVV
jgi:hypothetical protein